jgi:hypothetical protein
LDDRTLAHIRKVVNDNKTILAYDDVDASIYHDDEIDKEPLVSATEIHFNGKDEDGHEPFVFSTTDNGFQFCKTAQKPYDFAVCMILIILRDYYGEKVLTVSSDGDRDDWGRAIRAAEILGYDCDGFLVPEPEVVVYVYNTRNDTGIKINSNSHGGHGPMRKKFLKDYIVTRAAKEHLTPCTGHAYRDDLKKNSANKMAIHSHAYYCEKSPFYEDGKASMGSDKIW